MYIINLTCRQDNRCQIGKQKTIQTEKIMSNWFKSQDNAHVLYDVPCLVNHNFI